MRKGKAWIFHAERVEEDWLLGLEANRQRGWTVLGRKARIWSWLVFGKGSRSRVISSSLERPDGDEAGWGGQFVLWCLWRERPNGRQQRKTSVKKHHLKNIGIPLLYPADPTPAPRVLVVVAAPPWSWFWTSQDVLGRKPGLFLSDLGDFEILRW